jgi:hypothetical protein
VVPLAAEGQVGRRSLLGEGLGGKKSSALFLRGLFVVESPEGDQSRRLDREGTLLGGV